MNGLYIGAYLGKEKKCPVCKKTFFVCSEDWAYKKYSTVKHNPRYYCSWKCIRKWEAENEVKRGKPRCSQEQEIYRMMAGDDTPRQIAEKLGVSVSTVRYYMDRVDE